jgi:cytochrome c5
MRALKWTLWRAGLLGMVAVSGLFATPVHAAAGAPDRPILSKLALDADVKHYDAKVTDTMVKFQFNLTNTWTNEITIDRLVTSCGCTTASLPSNPWHIPPGGHGVVDATVNLHGKGAGLLKKNVTFYVSAQAVYLGSRVVWVEVNIPAPPIPPALSPAERKTARERAKSNPQMVFSDPKCASCHADLGRDRVGAKLYVADCGICHDSPKRDPAVPDLRTLKGPMNFASWRAIISDGKPPTMMPAFSAAHGGPLNDNQIHLLAQYLDRAMSGQVSVGKSPAGR